MILDNKLLMNNGITIPQLGLGTWKATKEEAVKILCEGTKLGYRHFDTAIAYGNEEGVGEGIKACGVKREELFITSKIPAEVKTYDGAVQAIKESITRLNTEYLDLMLIHWPWPWDDTRAYNNYYRENLLVWKAMEEACDNGLIRSIGVSNFSESDLTNILDNCKIAPAVNQILANVTTTPKAMLDFCNNNKIIVEAYSPNGNGRILDDARLVQMAARYNVTVAELCVKYTLQLGMVSIPKTTNVEHMKANCNMDWIISDEDMEILKCFETRK